MFALALAILTGLALGFALWPLAFRNQEATATEPETDFYRTQLKDIERDVAAGTLAAEEAIAARTEVARRLLAHTPTCLPPQDGRALQRRRSASVGILALIPTLTLTIYAQVGSPHLPDQPLRQRPLDLRQPGAVEAVIAKIEAHLRRDPQDRRGLTLLAPLYMQLGRFAEAAGCYRQLILLEPNTPILHAQLGEAEVALAQGVVTAAARAEFAQAKALPIAQFYLALALEQEGQIDAAKAAYTALEPQANGEDLWMIGLRSRLAALSPTRPEINAMVQSLADRLTTKGGTVEEWARLIRSWSVLGQPHKSREALRLARKALGNNAQIEALAHTLGLEKP